MKTATGMSGLRAVAAMAMPMWPAYISRVGGQLGR